MFSLRLELYKTRTIYTFKNNLLKSSTSNYCTSVHPKVRNIRDENFRLLFLGNDNFSLTCLRAVEEILPRNSLRVIVSNQNNIVGRYVNKNSISYLLWEDFKSKDNSETFDIGVVASFGHLIPKRIIEKCNLGILNAHGSLLPKYRGAAPISRVIINGDTETGVSIMKIAPHKFDVGPILARRKCRIHPHIRSPELTKIMAEIGGQALRDVLLNLDKTLEGEQTQRNEEASLAPKLTADMAQVNWEEQTAGEVYNLFRGLSGFLKLRTYYLGKRTDLDEFGLVFAGQDQIGGDFHECKSGEEISESTDFSRYYSYPVTVSVSSNNKLWKEASVPGQVRIYKDLILVCCADRNWVFVRRIKLGSKWMNAKDFQNGYVSKTKGGHVFSFEPETSCGAQVVRQL